MVSKSYPARYRKAGVIFPAGTALHQTRWARALHQFQLVAQLLRGCTDGGVRSGLFSPFNDAHFLNGVALTGLIQIGFHLYKGDDAVNSLPQPISGDRRAADFSAHFHFIQQLHQLRGYAVSLFIRSGSAYHADG